MSEEWIVELSVDPLIIHAVWGFKNSNGDPIIELPVSENGLSVSFQVFFTVIKGQMAAGAARIVDIISTQLIASKYLGQNSGSSLNLAVFACTYTNCLT